RRCNGRKATARLSNQQRGARALPGIRIVIESATLDCRFLNERSAQVLRAIARRRLFFSLSTDFLADARAFPLHVLFFGLFAQSRICSRTRAIGTRFFGIKLGRYSVQSLEQYTLARSLHFARELNQLTYLANFFLERSPSELVSHFRFHLFSSFKL